MTKKNFLIAYAIIAGLIIIDQLSKILIDVYLPLNAEITLIPGFFYITKVYNTGAAWGFGGDNTILLAMISLIASIFGLYFSTRNDFETKKTYSISLCMIVGGALGNMYDRFFTVGGIRKGVVDFISFHFGSYEFPVFNIADSVLVIGVILLMVDLLFFEEKRSKNA